MDGEGGCHLHGAVDVGVGHLGEHAAEEVDGRGAPADHGSNPGRGQDGLRLGLFAGAFGLGGLCGGFLGEGFFEVRAVFGAQVGQVVEDVAREVEGGRGDASLVFLGLEAFRGGRAHDLGSGEGGQVGGPAGRAQGVGHPQGQHAGAGGVLVQDVL